MEGEKAERMRKRDSHLAYDLTWSSIEVLVEERGKERSSTNDPAVKAATRRSALSQVNICW
jgi:hypothetical protein